MTLIRVRVRVSITASNIYKVCYVKETTDKTNTVKLLMNYCPMEHIPEQLEWGHQKEIAGSEFYFKKRSCKHQELSVAESGLVINRRWSSVGGMQKPIFRKKSFAWNCSVRKANQNH